MSKTKGVLVIALIWVVLLVLMEGASRAVFEARDEIKKWGVFQRAFQQELNLNPYQMAAPYGKGHWILRPGYRASLGKALKDKQAAGRDLGAAALGAAIEKYGDRDKRGLRINQDGFKGPELLSAGTHFRILAIGDSVTFGLGADSYPRLMERLLQQRGGKVEVVNAGVEGYSPRNVLFELPRYLALSPDLVTVYLGWNALFQERLQEILPRVSPMGEWLADNVRTIWLARRGWEALTVMWTDPQELARRSITKPKRPDRNAPAVAALDGYVPSFAGQVEEIVKRFCDKGVPVVLISLAGLYTFDEDPSPKALKIGHMPAFTDNPFVVARMIERYNAVLSEIAGATCAKFVDAAKWSIEHFRPRDAYFFDSGHMTVKGLEKFGYFLAEAVEQTVFGRQ